MILHFVSTSFKVLIASLVTGIALSWSGVAPADLLAALGLTPEDLLRYGAAAVSWAAPNILLGGMVILPVWLMVMIFRPPRN
jgi:hypothetical protein